MIPHKRVLKLFDTILHSHVLIWELDKLFLDLDLAQNLLIGNEVKDCAFILVDFLKHLFFPWVVSEHINVSNEFTKHNLVPLWNLLNLLKLTFKILGLESHLELEMHRVFQILFELVCLALLAFQDGDKLLYDLPSFPDISQHKPIFALFYNAGDLLRRLNLIHGLWLHIVNVHLKALYFGLIPALSVGQGWFQSFDPETGFLDGSFELIF